MRQRGQKNYAPLVLGLNTEASPLSAPEGTTSDEVNMILDTDGMVRRPRKGLCNFFELPSETLPEVVSETPLGLLGVSYWSREDYIVVVTAYTREQEGEDPEDPHLFFIDRYMYFINPEEADIEFSYFWREGIPTYEGTDQPNEADVQRAEQIALDAGVTFSPLNEGIVFSTGDEPLFVRPNLEGLDVFVINPQIRDFQLLETNIAIGVRPEGAITNTYRYNLLNAGWYTNTYRDSNGSIIENLEDYYHSAVSKYPSQAQVPQLGIRTDSQTGDKFFQAEEIDSISFGNSEAPRGHYIFPIRRINRVSKISNRWEDGTRPLPVTNVLSNGVDPGTGNPPPPGEPIGPDIPIPPCIPGEVCQVVR